MINYNNYGLIKEDNTVLYASQDFFTNTINPKEVDVLNAGFYEIIRTSGNNSPRIEDGFLIIETPGYSITKEQLSQMIFDNFAKCETDNITPMGSLQLQQWVQEGNMRAIETLQWFQNFYQERDTKLELVEGGDLTVNPSPDSYWKPWSFREMKELSL